MAAPYRLVVSSISHYNSVLVDRRHHQVVHYCDGPCSLLMHGLECTAAHRTLCSELTDLPPVGSEELLTRTSMLKGAGSAHLSNCRPMNGAKDHQRLPCVVPGFRRASSLQTPFSLKDITRDTINLASGKIKEFSFNHIPLRRGRKPRLDPLRQRCADVPFTGGPFCGNEENQPPFSLLPRSHPEDLCKETHATFTELSANIAVTSRQLDVSAEENLMAQILELTKVDTGTSGEDIGSCLNILLRCSDDLKKCTDIIRQCIKRKALVEGGGNQENKVVYQTIVAQLSRHLKKLPIGLECGLPGDQEHSDQSILFNSLHGFQQSLLCPNIDLEQPPRYEDVVCSPPSIQSLYANQSHSEVQEATRIPCSSEKVVQGPHCLPFPVPPTRDEAQHYGKVRASSPSAMFDVNVSNISGEGHDESGELLYTDEEPDDHEVLDSKIQETGKCSLDVAGLGAQGSILQDSLTAHGSSFAADVLEKTVFVMDVDQPQAEELCETFQGTDRVSFPEQRGSRKTTDSMEKFLMGLEHHSHGADKEPRVRTCGQQTDNLQCSTLERDKPAEGVALQKALAKPVTPPKGQPGVLASCDEEKKENDGAVLLEILERIENFAQELADGGMTVSSGTETTTQEQEATNLQQDTVSKSIASSSGMENPSQQEVTGEEREPKKIQQTLEIAWVQSKEKPEPPAGEIAKACASTISIPCFYFPNGVPVALGSALDQTIAHIEAAFSELGEQRATIQEMGKITKACGCPLYWKAPLFHSAGGGKIGFISASSLVEIWRKLSIRCHDDSSRFIYLLAKPDCSYLEQEDFITLLQDVVNSHPGLTFLKDAPEFHSRYITTVIQRIFYTVNRSWSGRITVHELRRSNFLQTLAALEEESDINRVTDYFSYEHFYVIYCKFWELDTDHNLLIDQRDLVRYNYHASSERIVERLFSGAVSRGSTGHSRGRMTYAEFVWFLISEEDKRTPTSVEYWFRCMDLDGDGVLSMYELEHFYQEQRHRLEAMGIDPLPFHDLMCQVLDLVRPQQPGKITLQDLKRCGMAHVFYDTFFSLEKYLDHEQRDPFTVHKEVDSDGQALSDWCRFAAEEYEVLVAEESESEHLEDESSEGDVECEKPMVSLEIAGGTEELDESDLLA